MPIFLYFFFRFVDTSTSSVKFIQYPSTPTNIDEFSVIKFEVKPSGNQLFDPKRSYLKTKIKLVKGESGDDTIAPAEKIGPICNLGDSLYKSVDVYFQHELISSSSNNYPIRAYLDILLNESNDAKLEQLVSQLFILDTREKFNVTDPGGA